MSRRTVLLLILLLATVVRLPDALRPVDGTILENLAWRECDTAMIARNFSRTGLNPCFPRVDFGGDGEGFVEMEFPFLPWAMAALSPVFGEHAAIGRLLNLLASLLALALFFRLAGRLLPPPAAAGAALFFALSPLPTGLATSLQPDGLMLLGVVGAVHFFLRHLDERRSADLILATLFLAFAVLAKASAVHIGILLLMLLFGRRRRPFPASAAIWPFGILALLPAVLWHLHARSFWLEYGNSLGLSSEYHWAGFDLFTDPRFLTGILGLQFHHVFTPAALVLVVVAGARWRGDPAVRVGLCWWAATLVFFLVSARTSADDWAFYYHSISAPAAALLFGAGIAAVRGRIAGNEPSADRDLGILLAAAAAAAALAALGASRAIALIGGRAVFALTGLIAFGLAFFVLRRRSQAVVLLLLVFCVPQALVHLGLKVATARQGARMSAPYACARELAPLLESAGLIAVAGERAFDAAGYPVDHRASYMFYWLDRKGFSVPLEAVDVTRLRALAARGARYFVIEQRQLRRLPGLAASLAAAFPKLHDCEVACLYALSPG